MTIWQLHMLNARGALTPIMAEIRAHAREVTALVETHLDLPRFDLVVRAGDKVSPDWGISSFAPAPGIIEITLDAARVTPEHFRRSLVRQMHVLSRWDGPGYGKSLGEALVSEGLAGHFVLQVLGGPPDPWDQVRPGTGVLKQAAATWARRDFDHGDWFLGRGRIRKWTGYGLGHRLVAEHLSEGGDAASLVHAPADDFRQALRRLMSRDGIEDDTDDGTDASVLTTPHIPADRAILSAGQELPDAPAQADAPAVAPLQASADGVSPEGSPAPGDQPDQ